MSNESNENVKNAKDWASILKNAEKDDEQSNAEIIKEEAEQASACEEKTTAATDSFTAEIEKYRNETLKLTADIQNLKKRHADEILKTQRFAGEKILKDLLPIVDSVEKSLTSLYASAEQSVIEGMELTLKVLLDTLHKQGVVQVNPKGSPFDPNLHEAMAMAPSTEVPEKHVIEVLQKGYTLHGRVIRPALVIVSANQNSV